jgi:hypothetical protein
MRRARRSTAGQPVAGLSYPSWRRCVASRAPRGEHDGRLTLILDRTGRVRDDRRRQGWVFLTAPLSAETARRLGTGLLREATAICGKVNLASYDRLFPSQDLLPAGGVGNLIALPLFRPRDRNATVFPRILLPATRQAMPRDASDQPEAVSSRSFAAASGFMRVDQTCSLPMRMRSGSSISNAQVCGSQRSGWLIRSQTPRPSRPGRALSGPRGGSDQRVQPAGD